MAGTIITDKIESDATYDSKIELVSPVLVSNTFAVKSTGGTGVFNIVGANTNTDRTFTLPDGSGALYNQSNILGTVSQSGGVPTGAIIERGSNANGEYVKYADGTMICTRNLTISRAMDTAYLGGFRSTGGFTILFASTFVNTGYSLSLLTDNTSAFSVLEIPNNRTTSSFDLIFTSVSSQTEADRKASAIAIGRWY